MNAEKREILVWVNDVTHMLGAIDLALGGYGYSVRFAADFQEAFDTLKKNAIDLVITDFSTILENGKPFPGKARELSSYATVMVLTGDTEQVSDAGLFRDSDGYLLIEPECGGASIPSVGGRPGACAA